MRYFIKVFYCCSDKRLARRFVVRSNIKLVRLALVVILTAVTFSLSVSDSFALNSGTRKMTVYNDAIKKGNVVYCKAYDGLFKVNIKTTKKTKLSKAPVSEYQDIHYMKLYKNYIYYVDRWGDNSKLYRVKTNGKNKKFLGWISKYAIKGNKIYYKVYREQTDSYENMEMKLNGSGKRHSRYSVNMKQKRANAKGYKIIGKKIGHKETEQNSIDVYANYLKRPGRSKVLLCKYDIYVDWY